MPSIILATRQSLLSLLLRTTPAGFTRPADLANLNFGLFSVMPGDDGTGGTEFATGGGYGYARKALAALDANLSIASDIVSLVAELKFDLFTGTTPEHVGTGVWDDGGVLRWAFPAGGLPLSHTATASTDKLARTTHGFVDKQKVRVEAIEGLAIPAGLAANTTYFVRDAAAGDFKVAATEAGAAIDITADGVCFVRRWYGKIYGVDERAVIPAGTQMFQIKG